jgi:hypothetical protein
VRHELETKLAIAIQNIKFKQVNFGQTINEQGLDEVKPRGISADDNPF